MNTPNQEQSFIAKFGWLIGIILLVSTIALQVGFWQVIPVFLDLYRDFGANNSVGVYYQTVLTIMTLAELGLLSIIMSLFFVESAKFHQFVKWFFIVYAISLPVILFITIAMLYSPIFVMGNVVG